jgi:hypothetical protein
MASMSRPYTHWTLPELRRISARRMAGEKWATIVPEYDVGKDAIRQALLRNGLAYGLRKPKGERMDEAIILEAIRLRNAQWTWPDIVAHTGWTKTWQALRKACHLHASQKHCTVWCGRGTP